MRYFILFFIIAAELIAQIDSLSLDNETDKVNWTRASIAGGGVVALNAGLWYYYSKAYYNQPPDKFKFFSDWYNYAINIDKIGHIHSAISLHKFSYRLARWSNFSVETSLWISSVSSWLHLLQMEIFDGYYAKYGFSTPDLAANTIGAIYPNLQYYFPFLSPFNLKVSYRFSQNYKNKYAKHIIDDYEGKTYWLTIDVHDILPEKLKRYWLPWLGIAIGYGGDKLLNDRGNFNQDRNKTGLGVQEWYVALDYNLLKLFSPAKESFLYDLLDILNLIHFPSPAIRISPSGIFYGIYF